MIFLAGCTIFRIYKTMFCMLCYFYERFESKDAKSYKADRS
jgi:hypothetical protein